MFLMNNETTTMSSKVYRVRTLNNMDFGAIYGLIFTYILIPTRIQNFQLDLLYFLSLIGKNQIILYDY